MSEYRPSETDTNAATIRAAFRSWTGTGKALAVSPGELVERTQE